MQACTGPHAAAQAEPRPRNFQFHCGFCTSKINEEAIIRVSRFCGIERHLQCGPFSSTAAATSTKTGGGGCLEDSSVFLSTVVEINKFCRCVLPVSLRVVWYVSLYIFILVALPHSGILGGQEHALYIRLTRNLEISTSYCFPNARIKGVHYQAQSCYLFVFALFCFEMGLIK